MFRRISYDVRLVVLLAVLDVAAVDLLVAALNSYSPQRPAFPPNVQGDRHVRSGAQCGQEQPVGSGAQVVAHVLGLVGHEGMARDYNHLLHVLQTLDRDRFHDGSARIFEANFCGNWAEQMLPVVYDEGVNKARITLPRLVQVMCENPTIIFGLYPQKGTLQGGSDADIVLFDPTVRHTLSAEAQHCRADFTMFEGKEVQGKPVFSMQRGEVVIEDGELGRAAGKARFPPGDGDPAAYAPNGYPVK